MIQIFGGGSAERITFFPVPGLTIGRNQEEDEPAYPNIKGEKNAQ